MRNPDLPQVIREIDALISYFMGKSETEEWLVQPRLPKKYPKYWLEQHTQGYLDGLWQARKIASDYSKLTALTDLELKDPEAKNG